MGLQRRPGHGRLRHGDRPNVDSDPWLVLGLTASPTSIETGGNTSALSATVNTDSGGGAVTGPFFPSTPVTFGVGARDHLPGAPSLSATNTAGSTLTSGAVAGAASPNVTLDNATVSTPVTFTSPPAPNPGPVAATRRRSRRSSRRTA